MSNRRGMLLLVGACAAVCIAIVLLAPPSRLFFRVNHLVYLVNDHRYSQALLNWEALSERNPRVTEKLPDYDERIVAAASEWFMAQPAGKADGGELEHFLALMAARPRLAPKGRRLELQLSIQNQEPAEATLAKARAILEKDGFDAEAVWWATRLQYDPRKPLTIPPELLAMREAVLRPAPAGVDFDSEHAARLAWLRALLALADRDWGHAASLLEGHRMQPEARLEDGLVLGIAQLEAGRAAVAVARFNEYLVRAPRDQTALASLARAHLKLRNFAWGAAVLDRLRSINGRAADQALHAELMPRSPEDKDPIELLSARMAAGLDTNGLTIEALDWLATSESQRVYVDAAARSLLGDPEKIGGREIELLNFTLGRPLGEWGPALAAAIAQSPTSATQSAQSVTRVAEGKPPLEDPRQANQLHTHDSTKYQEVLVPPQAGLMMIMVDGIQQGGEWPVIHVRTDFAGAKTFYAARSGGAGRGFAMAIGESRDAGRAGEVAISLLNGNADQNRTIFIKEIRFF